MDKSEHADEAKQIVDTLPEPTVDISSILPEEAVQKEKTPEEDEDKVEEAGAGTAEEATADGGVGGVQAVDDQ